MNDILKLKLMHVRNKQTRKNNQILCTNQIHKPIIRIINDNEEGKANITPLNIYNGTTFDTKIQHIDDKDEISQTKFFFLCVGLILLFAGSILLYIHLNY